MLLKFYKSVDHEIEKHYINKFKNVIPDYIQNIYLEECYYVQCVNGLNNYDEEKLLYILDCDKSEDSYISKFKEDDCEIIEIGPRINYSTPFSTNCVSICKSLGMDKIERLERSMRYYMFYDKKNSKIDNWISLEKFRFINSICDKMTQTIYPFPLVSFKSEFDENYSNENKICYDIDVMKYGRSALETLNTELDFGLDADDIDSYVHLFKDQLKRNPTNIECFDLAQSNSEHSRHWFFKGRHVIDGKAKPLTLMQLVMDTQKHTNQNNVIKFSDNSSGIQGFDVIDNIPSDHVKTSPYKVTTQKLHVILTAETHNFPTGISPFPGAATGIGGRMRDVQATGRGAHVIAGTAGYCVGNLLIEGFPLPWENRHYAYPPNMATPIKILIEASDGASDYGNKFGEPIISGFTRSFGAEFYRSSGLKHEVERREWIKPIMFTAGIGSIPDPQIHKLPPEIGMRVVKLGGPVYKIGLGGGSASSKTSNHENQPKLSNHSSDQDRSESANHSDYPTNNPSINTFSGGDLNDSDFNAVQRGDPEMQQKMNRVIRACSQSSDPINGANYNPLLSLHDQGAGGNGNVLKELVEPLGALIKSSAFTLGDDSSGPLEIWAAEYQESNAALIAAPSQVYLSQICAREKCGLDVVGHVTGTGSMVFTDDIRRDARGSDSTKCIDLPLDLISSSSRQKIFHSSFPTALFTLVKTGSLSTLISDSKSQCQNGDERCSNDDSQLCIDLALDRVLRLVSVGSKQFLTNKVDRSVSGLVARQQCVGPSQLPLADAAIISLSHFPYPHTSLIGSMLPTPDVGHSTLDLNFVWRGAVTAIGEQPFKNARMALGEAMTNMASCIKIPDRRDIKASANWMWPAKNGSSVGGGIEYTKTETDTGTAKKLKGLANGIDSKDGSDRRGNDGEGAALYLACESLCSAAANVGIGFDGGKDSLTMAARVHDKGLETVVKAPGSVVISAYTTCPDITRQFTADLKCCPLDEGNLAHPSTLIWIPFSQPNYEARCRIGGSAFLQCFNALNPIFGYDGGPNQCAGDLDFSGTFSTCYKDSCPLFQCPDMDDPQQFRDIFDKYQSLLDVDTKYGRPVVKSSHDVSDGGLLITILEMAWAAQHPTDIKIDVVEEHFKSLSPLQISKIDCVLAFLFAEELGIVVQVSENDVTTVIEKMAPFKCHVIGHCYERVAPKNGSPFDPIKSEQILRKVVNCKYHERSKEEQLVSIYSGQTKVYAETLLLLKRRWESLSHALEKMQIPNGSTYADNESVMESLHFLSRFHAKANDVENGNGNIGGNIGFYLTSFDMNEVDRRYSKTLESLENVALKGEVTDLPMYHDIRVFRVAILREEGTNGDKELSSLIISAGFEAWDLTITDFLFANEKKDAKNSKDHALLNPALFRGVVFPGGFSYGDVLGSAKGWAATILLNPTIRSQFQAFYRHPNTFSFGVCNGCQLMAALSWVAPVQKSVHEKNLAILRDQYTMPGLKLKPNDSGRFESRFCRLEIHESPCIFTRGMEGSVLGCWIAHGEGKMVFKNDTLYQGIKDQKLIPLSYIDPIFSKPTMEYPYNPNGSIEGTAGICSQDGRHFALMPHPERCFLSWQWPYIPSPISRAIGNVKNDRDKCQNDIGDKTPSLRAFDSLYAGSASPWLKMFHNVYDWCLI
ncbi:unnamed protein product [Gordionus sp. m RMFG-2023]